jgi:hypothetical protein
MKTINASCLSFTRRILFELSTLPIIQGWFKNARRAARFFQSVLTVQYKTGISGDSLDSTFFAGEGGRFILGNFFNGFG